MLKIIGDILPTSSNPFIVMVEWVILLAAGAILLLMAGSLIYALLAIPAALLGHPLKWPRPLQGWPWGTGTTAAQPHIPEELRREVLKRDNYTCVYCGTRKEIEIDHIIPKSKGGATTLGNLQVICHPCNARKSNH